MKSFAKNKGWLVLMEGGPSDGIYVRTYTQTEVHWATFAHYEVESDPVKNIENASPRINVSMFYGEGPEGHCQDPTGHYRLTLVDPPKMAKASGTEVPMRKYVWTPSEAA